METSFCFKQRSDVQDEDLSASVGLRRQKVKSKQSVVGGKGAKEYPGKLSLITLLA